MIEILALISLCKTNKKNALARGRKGGLFIALTIILWFVMEFVGFIVGYVVFPEGYVPYFFGILFAAVGALISFLIAKNAPQGSYVDPNAMALNNIVQNGDRLSVPASIVITREKAFTGSAAKISFKLNGQPIGSLNNGGQMVVSTNIRQNVLESDATFGTSDPMLPFDVADGTTAEIFYKADRFMPEKCIGIYQPTVPSSIAAQANFQPAMPQ